VAQRTVYICEDHQLYRDGLERLLTGDFQVIGGAFNGTQAQRDIPRLRPDMVLLDLNLPGVNGLELIRMTREELPTCIIIVLTSHDDPTLRRKARLAGANAYLIKDMDNEDLLTVLRSVVSPEGFRESPVRDWEEPFDEDGSFTALASLTMREMLLVQGLVAGKSALELAAALSISENTVKNHRKNIYRKLGVSSVQELILLCNRHGLLG
jgi:two-component system NarL family response regulator